MALGATASWVVQAFVREGLVLAAAGLLLGIAGAVAVTRVLSSRLFGVTPLDVTTFADRRRRAGRRRRVRVADSGSERRAHRSGAGPSRRLT